MSETQDTTKAADGQSLLTGGLGRETETIDRLFLELSQFTKARTEREMQLDQLLYAVQQKFPGETRFETALRYIRRMEEPSDCGQAKTDGPNVEVQRRAGIIGTSAGTTGSTIQEPTE